jgi:GH25 family lysozyme M1 (1,4-beta-N-acetylmuramidase)
MAVKGIDVSEWQGFVDWSKVKMTDTKFAILRAGYGREISQKDKQFENNYKGCKAVGMPCGVYWYNYAVTPEEAKREAAVCLEILKGKQFEYPIYYDVEEQKTLALGKDKVSAIIKAFCEELEKAGYFVGLYMSASPLNAYVSEDVKRRYVIWVAHYGVSKPSYNGSYGIWQNSSTGKVNGISGNVDTDIAYESYPTIIKSAGLNGYKKPQPTPVATQPTAPAQPVKAKKKVTITIDDHTYSGLLEEI